MTRIRVDRLVHAFGLSPPAVARPGATHVIVCLSVRCVLGYTVPLAIGLEDTHGGLQSVVASRMATADVGGAIEVAIDLPTGVESSTSASATGIAP